MFMESVSNMASSIGHVLLAYPSQKNACVGWRRGRGRSTAPAKQGQHAGPTLNERPTELKLPSHAARHPRAGFPGKAARAEAGLTWWAWYLATSVPLILPAQSVWLATHAPLPAQQTGLAVGHFTPFAELQSLHTGAVVRGPGMGSALLRWRAYAAPTCKHLERSGNNHA